MIRLGQNSAVACRLPPPLPINMIIIAGGRGNRLNGFPLARSSFYAGGGFFSPLRLCSRRLVRFYGNPRPGHHPSRRSPCLAVMRIRFPPPDPCPHRPSPSSLLKRRPGRQTHIVTQFGKRLRRQLIIISPNACNLYAGDACKTTGRFVCQIVRKKRKNFLKKKNRAISLTNT